MKNKVQTGDEIVGTVDSIEPYGIWVSFGDARGLVPEIEAAWILPVKLRNLGMPGDPLRVIVKRVEDTHFVASIKDLNPGDNPWLKAKELRLGQIVSGTVSREVDFGVFVEIIPGIEALLRGDQAAEVVVGQVVKVQITDVEYESQKIRAELA